MNSKYLEWIEAEVRKLKFGNRPASLYEPIRYIMQLGGKRIRPMLTLLAYSLYRNDVKKIVSLATSVEAFHNFTLLHDDIMDKAPLRRGKATVHEKWNVNTAILSGDVMLVKVYDQLLNVAPDLLKPVLTRFNSCAAEVCEGQQWDMEFEANGNVTEAEYIHMIKQKTAVLLGFSLEFGALLAHAPASDQKELKNFGLDIGVGFQLKDDWLDVYADNGKFGKQIGGDIISNKKTFLLVSALNLAKGKEKKELQKWIKAKSFNPQAKVKAVKSIYDKLDISTLTEKKVNFYFNRGFSRLAKLNIPSEKKKDLRDYTFNLIDRKV